MPAAAKFSKQFYDRLGHEIVDEFVNWFNAMDTTYRSDLVRVNELNYSRFDAKLEQRIVQLEAKLSAKIDAVAHELRTGLAATNARIDLLEQRIDVRFVQCEERFVTQMREAFAAQREDIDRRFRDRDRSTVALVVSMVGLMAMVFFRT